MAEFKYEITEHFGDLPQNANGWAKQLNKISWMERTPKYDLREWSPDGTKNEQRRFLYRLITQGSQGPPE